VFLPAEKFIRRITGGKKRRSRRGVFVDRRALSIIAFVFILSLTILTLGCVAFGKEAKEQDRDEQSASETSCEAVLDSVSYHQIDHQIENLCNMTEPRESPQPDSNSGESEETCSPSDSDTVAVKKSFIPVLLYHHLAPESEGKHLTNGAIVTVEEFSLQMRWLHVNGYETITVSELAGLLLDGKAFPEKTVCITFDDGYDSVGVHAAPIMERLGLRGTVFVIGEMVGKLGPQFGHLSWEDISVLSEKGVFEFQNHTYSAHRLNEEGKPEILDWDEERILKDIKALNNEFIVHGISEPEAIAYPYGAYNDTVLSAVRKSGLKFGFTVEHGSVLTDSEHFRLPRIIVFPGTSTRDFSRSVEKR
jgi:peptidoglycan/xylan/chitin deacetylase (PgdA/CDA1 family)